MRYFMTICAHTHGPLKAKFSVNLRIDGQPGCPESFCSHEMNPLAQPRCCAHQEKSELPLIDHAHYKMSWKLHIFRSKEKKAKEENKINSFCPNFKKENTLDLETTERRKTSKLYGNRMLEILIHKDFSFSPLSSDRIMTEQTFHSIPKYFSLIFHNFNLGKETAWLVCSFWDNPKCDICPLLSYFHMQRKEKPEREISTESTMEIKHQQFLRDWDRLGCHFGCYPQM